MGRAPCRLFRPRAFDANGLGIVESIMPRQPRNLVITSEPRRRPRRQTTSEVSAAPRRKVTAKPMDTWTEVVGSGCEWLDKAERPALVLGGADCVWRDVAVLETLIGGFWPGLVIAVNDVGEVWPRRIDHWATVHPENLLTPRGWENPDKGQHGWLGYRLSQGLTPPGLTWCHAKRANWPNIDRTLAQMGSGSSGLFGVAVALEVGADAIVLCGISMDDRPHFAESRKHKPGTPWTGNGAHRRAWTKNLATLKPVVRSMSGWTRELLGPPSPDMVDYIDPDLYRAGDTDLYTLPNGGATGLAGFMGGLGVNES